MVPVDFKQKGSRVALPLSEPKNSQLLHIVWSGVTHQGLAYSVKHHMKQVQTQKFDFVTHHQLKTDPVRVCMMSVKN